MRRLIISNGRWNKVWLLMMLMSKTICLVLLIELIQMRNVLPMIVHMGALIEVCGVRCMLLLYHLHWSLSLNVWSRIKRIWVGNESFCPNLLIAHILLPNILIIIFWDEFLYLGLLLQLCMVYLLSLSKQFLLQCIQLFFFADNWGHNFFIIRLILILISFFVMFSSYE